MKSAKSELCSVNASNDRGVVRQSGSLLSLCPSRWPCGKEAALRAGGTGIDIRLPCASLTSDFRFLTIMAALPGAWLYRVSARTGLHGVSTV